MDNNTGIKKEIHHCHTDDFHKTMVTILAPNNNNVQQVRRMRLIALKFGYKVLVGFIR